MTTPTQGPSCASRRVLLIEDDDADMVMFMRCKDRAKLDADVKRARNPHEAFDLLRQQHSGPAGPGTLLLLDLNMPYMNGIEFLQELRADPVLRDTVVIAVSGSDDPGDLRAAYAHHVAAYVVKTDESTERLVRLVGAWLDAATPPPS